MGIFLPAVLLVGACGSTEESSFEFALMGDNPYGESNVPKFEALIEHVNSRRDLEWVLHLGDTKGGNEPCTDELLRSRFELFQRFEAPFIFTPGDNDWFDCADDPTGGFDEYERLAFVRQLFFPDPQHTTGGRAMPVESQGSSAAFGEFAENLRWIRGEVVFSTVHLVGLPRPSRNPATAERRMDAALAWIARAFEIAQERDARGVFLATQADPWFVSGLPAVMNMMFCPQCLAPRPGLERLYTALAEHAVSFGRPVVLAVGDTHVFRVDKPLHSVETGLLIENFTRVETFGSPDVHWVRVTVDPSTPWLFEFHQELVEANVRK
ncbi:MAG: hypothetical protein O7I93_06665 [Gemmatimonadetes bacterium]|nr:hypothetical protein [Gemmatimonadota bacterium]